MTTEGQRDRHSPANGKPLSHAEMDIRAAHAELLEARTAVEDKTVALAMTIAAYMGDVGATEIGTWLISPEKPEGVTRQQVWKIVNEKVGKKAAREVNSAVAARRQRPTRD